MSHPFYEKQLVLTQPDGVLVEVVGWGDQYQAIFETLDGFTIIRDHRSGYLCYAQLDDKGEELVSTGVHVGSKDKSSLNIQPKLQGTKSTISDFSALHHDPRIPRWEERYDERKAAALTEATSGGAFLAPPGSQTVGEYLGLCLLIQFPDVPGTITRDQVDTFCNKPKTTIFGNNGSVYDYFLDASDGKLRYKTVVAPYYTAAHSRDYYTDPSVPYGQRAQELIQEALKYHLAHGFNFKSLTTDSKGAVYANNVFYAGECVNGWGKGLWPHAFSLSKPFPVAPGKSCVDYQITNMGPELTLGTFCHENGHMLCDFPDLYSYVDQRRGVGRYCLMCLGGQSQKNPIEVGAYLKYRAGWANPITKIKKGLKTSATAGKNELFIHSLSKIEYFIIENRVATGRDAALPDAGLAIWHIDELGSNTHPELAPAGHRHFECTLVQADGRDDLTLGANPGDSNDLFHKGFKDQFSDTTKPNSKWWNGANSGLKVHAIGAAGAKINFSADI